MNITDAAVLDRWIDQRDAGAFRELVNRYSGLVFGACRRILGNAKDAEEVTQECFEALAFAERVPADYLGPWLHRVATNLARKRVRTDVRRRGREERFAAEQPTRTQIDWDDIYGYVDEAIAGLPDEVREPLVAHYLEGETQADIARAMGIPRQTLTNRVHKGIEQVRKSLAEKGVPVGASALVALFGANLAEAAPATLTTALGKLAVAGVGSGAAVTGVSAGGGLLLKKALIAVALVVLASTGAVMLRHAARHSEEEPGQQAAAAQPTATINTAGERENLVARESTAAQASGDSARAENAAVTKDEAAPGGSISGRVYVAETGRGLEGVGIVCQPDDGSRTFRYSEADLISTDSEGHYRVAGLESGDYKLLCNSAWRSQDSGDEFSYKVELLFAGNANVRRCRVEPESEVRGLDFRAIVGAKVSGIVLDVGGSPIEEAEVVVTSRTTTLQTKSRADGSFKVGGIAAASEVHVYARLGRTSPGVRRTADGRTLTLKAEESALASGVVGPLSVPESGLTGVELHLRPGGVVSGVLLDWIGSPLADSRVMARSYEGRLYLDSRMGTTDQEGRFVLTGIPEGRYDMAWNRPEPGDTDGSRGWAPHKAEVLQTVHVDWGQRLEGLVLRAAKEGPSEGELAISGVVTDSQGVSVAGAQVRAQTISYAGSKTATTDNEGRYRVAGLEEGAYRVSVSHPDLSGSARHPVEAGSVNVDFVLQQLGSVSGQVVYADSGEPVKAFGVRATTKSREWISVEDEEGRFHIAKAWAGRNRVEAEAEGYLPAHATVDVVPGQETAGVVIRLERGARVDGTVVTEQGEPLGGARVYVRSVPELEDERETQAAALTDGDGRFHLENVNPKVHKLTAWHPDHAAGVVDYVPGTKEVRIVLIANVGVVEGMVTVSGVPEQRAKVSMIPSNLLTPTARNYSARTGRDGRFRFTEVVPGEYTVSAWVGPEMGDSTNTRNLSRAVVAEGGMVTEAHLDVPERSARFEGRVTHNGQPPTTAFAFVTVSTSMGEEQYPVEVTADGSMTLEAVAAGNATCRVSIVTEAPGSSVSKSVSFEIAPGETVRQTFAFDGGAVVSGQVERGGIEGQVVAFLLPGNTAFAELNLSNLASVTKTAVAQTLCDESGRFALPAVEEGAYTVLAYTFRMPERTLRWGAVPCVAREGQSGDIRCTLR